MPHSIPSPISLRLAVTRLLFATLILLMGPRSAASQELEPGAYWPCRAV